MISSAGGSSSSTQDSTATALGMSKTGSGKSSKGGSSKGSASSFTDTVTRSKALQTPAEQLVLLRSALRSDDGVKDRDVSADLLPQLLVYQRNELDLTVRFFTGSSLTKDLRQFMFRLAKKNHRAIADASGYGWDDDEYKEALKAPEQRYLAAFDSEGAPVAFINFEFSLQGALVDEMAGVPSLLVQDLQTQKAVRRKGLGRHLLSLVQLIAKKRNLSTVAAKVFVGDKTAQAFMGAVGGFAVSYEFVPEGEAMEIYEKSLVAPAAPAAKAATPSKPAAVEAAVSPPTSPGDEAEPNGVDAGSGSAADGAAAEPNEPSAPLTRAEKEKARKKAQKARKKAEKAAKAAAEAAAADAGEPAAASPAADAGASTAEASGAGAAAEPRPVELQFDSAALGQAFKLLSPEELQAATLAAFYAHVKVEKTAAEIDEILSKRRVAGSTKWFDTLCGKLEKKYGVAPAAAYEQSKAAKAAAPAPAPAPEPAPAPAAVQQAQPQEEDAVYPAQGHAEEPADDVDNLLEELMDMFKQNNGRDPTDEEVQQWVATLREAQQESENAAREID